MAVVAAVLVTSCSGGYPTPSTGSTAPIEMTDRGGQERWPQLSDIPLAVKRIVIPQTKRGCSEAGGNWSQQGLGGGPFRCDLRAADARKICTDSLQCEGECLVANDLPVGSKAIGSCSDFLSTYGCHRLIEGSVVREVCTD